MTTFLDLVPTDDVDFPAPTSSIQPAIAVERPLHLGITISITGLVGVLFVAVYFQLFMVLFFGYKLLTYQTVLLFDILLWAALRLTLYSFYYYNCCELVDHLPPFPDWLLVALPSALQFISLAVLVHFFGQSLYRVLERRQDTKYLEPPYGKMRKYRVVGWILWLSAVLIFIVGNVTFSVLIRLCEGANQMLVIMRVVVLEGLFLIMGLTLAVCILMIFATRMGKDVLEAQGVHKCKPLLISILLILLFLSRATYNFVALSERTMEPYGYGWKGWTVVTDTQADNEFKGHYGYIVYFTVQVIWEVIPTYLIVFFFRVRVPSANTFNATAIVNDDRDNQKHFFDNPHRYDTESDEMLYGSLQRSSQMAIPSLPSNTRARISPSRAGYGSTAKNYHYSAPSKYSINSTPQATYMPGTTPPPLFTHSPSFFSDR